jgi:uncharacterized protein (TIGR01244 family)
MRALSDTVWASAQVSPDALTALAGAGVGRIVNNRPDHEEPGQPTAAEMEAAARAAGLDYRWIPISGLPSPAQAAAVAEALADGTPTLMFCRSGMRSSAAWAMAECAGGADPDAVRAAAAVAGYDLSRLPL